jgi:hypothetical protein
MLLIITQWEHMAAVFASVCLPFAAMPLLQNIGSKHRSDFFRVSDRALLAALMLDSVFGFLHVYSMTTMGGALLYDPHMWLLSARLLFFFSAAASWISSITSGPPPASRILPAVFFCDLLCLLSIFCLFARGILVSLLSTERLGGISGVLTLSTAVAPQVASLLLHRALLKPSTLFVFYSTAVALTWGWYARTIGKTPHMVFKCVVLHCTPLRALSLSLTAPLPLLPPIYFPPSLAYALLNILPLILAPRPSAYATHRREGKDKVEDPPSPPAFTGVTTTGRHAVPS